MKLVVFARPARPRFPYLFLVFRFLLLSHVHLSVLHVSVQAPPAHVCIKWLSPFSLSLPLAFISFLFFLRCYDLASDSHFSILDREWNNQIVKIWHYCNFVVEENLQMKIDFRCLCTSLSNAFASAVCLRSLSLVALHIYFEQ